MRARGDGFEAGGFGDQCGLVGETGSAVGGDRPARNQRAVHQIELREPVKAAIGLQFRCMN